MSRHTTDDICPLCSDKLTQADAFLIDWFLNTVKPKFPKAHISCSYRDKISQEEAFSEGKTKLHYPYSQHNFADEHGTPKARALDIFEIIGGLAAFNPAFYAAVNDLNVEQGLPVLWGAHWVHLGDSDHFGMKP